MSRLLKESPEGVISAKHVLQQLQIKEPPVKPEDVAKELEIDVTEKEFTGQIEGCAVKGDGFAGIMLSKRLQYGPRKRFTLAHEIGHCRISSHIRQQYECTNDVIGILSGGLRKEETEANQFAAELLMPTNLFRPIAENMEIGIETVEYLARTYETSLTSTAIRYVRFSVYACAVVISEDTEIKSFCYSEPFRSDRRCFLDRKTPLHSNSVAKDIFLRDPDFSRQLRDSDTIPAFSWFPDIEDRDILIGEEAISLPRFRQVLSLIWIDEEENNEDW